MVYSMHACMHACMHMCIHSCVSVIMYLHMLCAHTHHVCVYVYVYVCVLQHVSRGMYSQAGGSLKPHAVIHSNNVNQ